MVGDDVYLILPGMSDCIPEIGAELHHDLPVSRAKLDSHPPEKGGLKIDEMESNLVEGKFSFGRPADDLDWLFALPSGRRAVRASPRAGLGEPWEGNRWRGQ